MSHLPPVFCSIAAQGGLATDTAQTRTITPKQRIEQVIRMALRTVSRSRCFCRYPIAPQSIVATRDHFNVFGIDTGTIATKVVWFLFLWDRAYQKFVGIAVSLRDAFGSIQLVASPKRAIAADGGTRPEPASRLMPQGAMLVNLSPEPFLFIQGATEVVPLPESCWLSSHPSQSAISLTGKISFLSTAAFTEHSKTPRRLMEARCVSTEPPSDTRGLHTIIAGNPL